MIGNLIKGFFAYLALTPLIFCWGLLLIVLSIITFASFEAQAGNAIDAVSAVLTGLTERYPFLERFALDSPAIKEFGVIEIDNSNLFDVIFGLYKYIGLPFVIIGVLIDLVKGPRPPRSLSRKIKLFGLATLAVIALLFVNFLFGSEVWSGSALAWLLMFTIGPVVVWVVSVVSLAMHHFIASLELEANS